MRSGPLTVGMEIKTRMTSGTPLTGQLGTWLRSRGLRSHSADVRIRAIQRLTTANDPQASGPLTEALTDPDPGVRAAAATALAQIGTSVAIDPLLSALSDETEYDVLAAQAAALAQLDPRKATQALMGMLDDEGNPLRARMASLLRKILWDRLDNAERARVAIVQGAWEEVADLGAAAMPALETVVRRGTPHTKRAAAEVLGIMVTTEAQALLGRLLSDSQLDTTGRQIAAWALKKFYWQDLSKTQHVWIAILEEDWSGVVDLGDAAIEPLCNLLTTRSRGACRPAAETLAKIGGSRAAEALCRVLADNAQEVSPREIAARALGAIGGESAVPVLAAALDDEAWVVREAAAASLQTLQWTPAGVTERARYAIAGKDWGDLKAFGEAAIEPLIDALKYGTVGLAAGRALLALGQAGLDRLLAVLRDTSRPMSVREVTARVLAEAGDARAIEPVEAMLDEHDSVLRQVAVWTLTRFGWKPSNDRQKALVAIANEDWDELGQLGSAAVEPLLALAEDSLAPQETVKALRRVLELSAPHLSVHDLRAIALLGDLQAQNYFVSAKYYSGGSDMAAASDCKAARELACAELARRGVIL